MEKANANSPVKNHEIVIVSRVPTTLQLIAFKILLKGFSEFRSVFFLVVLYPII